MISAISFLTGWMAHSLTSMLMKLPQIAIHGTSNHLFFCNFNAGAKIGVGKADPGSVEPLHILHLILLQLKKNSE